MKLSNVIHILAGALTSALSVANPCLSILLFASYIIYEVVQEVYNPCGEIIDDLLEYLTGLAAGSIVYMCFWAVGLAL